MEENESPSNEDLELNPANIADDPDLWAALAQVNADAEPDEFSKELAEIIEQEQQVFHALIVL